MKQGLKIIKQVLPRNVRRFLRARHRDFVFRRALRRSLKDLSTSAELRQHVIPDLVYGWGNEGWSAKNEYIVACVRHALASKGPILECGSGLTTILIGAIARKNGIQLWTLEHMPSWGNRINRQLKKYRLDSVHLCVQPLKEYSGFCWYDPPLDSMPDNFSLVICDGPPAATPGGRFGLIPVMKEKLAPDCVILLDDAEREQERAIVKRWGTQLNANYGIVGSEKPYFRIMLKDAH